jgi:hypothetical protein
MHLEDYYTASGYIVYSDQFYNVHTLLNDIDIKGGLIYINLSTENTGGGLQKAFEDAYITIKLNITDNVGGQYTSISTNLQLNIVPSKGRYVNIADTLNVNSGNAVVDSVYRYANQYMIHYIGKLTNSNVFTIPDRYDEILYINASDGATYNISGLKKDKVVFENNDERYIDIKIIPK